VWDAQTNEYVASLPEVDTARLPRGTLFLAQGKIYQVIETGAGGFHKAREWRQSENTDVALIPDSFPSKFLPLIRRGRVLPVYRSRLELTDNTQPACFVFPTEALALDAAYLDLALVQSSGAFVRNQGHEPAFAITDGVHMFRLYFYRQSLHGRKTDLLSLVGQPPRFTPRGHTDGPRYWRLLPLWTEETGNLDETQPIRAVRLSPDDPTVPMPRVQPE